MTAESRRDVEPLGLVDTAPSGAHERVEATRAPLDSDFPLDALFGRTQPSEVGRFAIVRELGRGAMGVVYLAHDGQLDRPAAVKLVRGAGESELARGRLLREAQALARIAHPNVVTVYEAGVHEHEVYIAMEYIDGLTLRAQLEARPHEASEILALFIAAAHGLDAAHQRGLIHRDFKPDNVMVDRDGRVRVMDFGLVWAEPGTHATAKRADADTSDARLTAIGALLGSPAYMAPEQFRDDALDPRADQFSFCVALWEALYGQRPFLGTTVAEVSTHILAGELTTPPAAAEVPAWVRPVLERGLSVDPARRWPSLRELIDALELPPRRRLRRRRIAAAVGLTLALTGTVTVAALQSRTLHASKAEHDFEQQLAEADALLAEGRAAAALPLVIRAAAWLEREGGSSVLDNEVERALFEAVEAPLHWAAFDELPLASLADVLALSPDGRLLAEVHVERFWDNRLLWAEGTDLFDALRRGDAAWQLDEALVVRVHELATRDAVTLHGLDCHPWALSFSPDAERLSAQCGDGRMWTWDTQRGEQLLSLPADVGARISPDGRLVAAIEGDALSLRSTANGEPLLRLTPRAKPQLFAFAPDSRLLAGVDADGRLQVWELEHARVIAELQVGEVAALRLHGDDAMLLSCAGLDQRVRTFDLRSGELLEVLAPTPVRQDGFDATRVHELDVSPDGRHIALYVDRQLWMWERGTGELSIDDVDWTQSTLDTGKPFVVATSRPDPLAFSPDGARLLVRQHDAGARLYDVDAGAALADLGSCFSCSFSPDGRTIVVAHGDIDVVDASSGARTTRIEDQRGYAALFLPTSDVLVSAENDHVRFRRARTLRSQIAKIEHDVDVAVGVVFSSDTSEMVSVDGERIHVWDARSGEPLAQLHGHVGRIHAIATARVDGHDRLLSAGGDGQLRVWALAERALLEQRHAFDSPIRLLAVSPDATTIAAADERGRVQVWSPAGSHVLAHPQPLHALALSADASRVITASGDQLRSWDARTGTLLREWTTGAAAVQVFAHAGATARIATRGPGTQIDIWDEQRGELLQQLQDGGDGPALVFSRDGTRLASPSRVWDVDGRQVGELWARDLPDRDEAVSIAPDGRLVAVERRLLDAATGDSVLAFDGSQCTTQFSDDGTRIAQLCRSRLLVRDASSGFEAACRRLEPLLDYRRVADICTVGNTSPK